MEVWDSRIKSYVASENGCNLQMEKQNHKQCFCYSSAQQDLGLDGLFSPSDGCWDVLFSYVRFSYGHLVRECNHILLIFQIHQNFRGFIENKMFQWALEIKYETDLNSIWKCWQRENICKQWNDESGSLNYSNLIWMKVWRRVRRTYFNKLEQIAKGCSSFSITSYLSKKIEFYIYIHTFHSRSTRSYWNGCKTEWSPVTSVTQEVSLRYNIHLSASPKKLWVS